MAEIAQTNNITNEVSEKTTRKINIRCKDLFKIYNQGNLEVVALRRINLRIYEGEIVVIMGPSGSGKTTLLNCLAGLEKPTAGQIFLKNYEVSKLNDNGIEMLLQNEVGIIFQFFNLIPSLSARGNIELPMVIAQRNDKIISQRSKELLKLMNLEERSNQNPYTLSGGEKQRIAIAMAISNDPTVILADEPTGNVDSISGDKIKEMFVKYIKDHPKKSIVIVTHDHSFINIADRTFILKDGKIIRELGKKEIDQEEDLDDIQDFSEIYDDEKSRTEIEEIIDPLNNYINYDNITECRHCNSTNIRKMYDKIAGDFKIIDNHLVTRVIVNCLDCNFMEYRTASISNMENVELK